MRAAGEIQWRSGRGPTRGRSSAIFNAKTVTFLTLMVGLNTFNAIGFKYAALRMNTALPDAARLLGLPTAALWWFALASIAGFLSSIAFTMLLRYWPLNLAFAIAGALWFLCVQVVGAVLIFHETITIVQWVGVGLLITGLVLISTGIKG